MSYAINLRSDHKSSQAIRSLWRACGALESTPSMPALKYPPHITLAIYDETDIHDLISACSSAAEVARKSSVRFERLNYFETPHAIVIWAEPMDNDFFRPAHSKIHASIASDLCRPHYRPGAWVPHCSLATTIDPSQKERALEFVNRPMESFEVIFDVLDCVSFPPVKVLHEQTLQTNAADRDVTRTTLSPGTTKP